jgi:arabinogalactan oligomer / maltooligosaccharide transport system substrate-binding protein
MKKRYGVASVITAVAVASGVLVTSPASAATTEIVIWADERRGPNLEKLMAQKNDWVKGYTTKVVTFSSFDTLKTAFDNATEKSGPDIILAANDWVTAGAKAGKLAPLTLSGKVKSQFTAGQLFDLSYKGKLYGLPVDVNNVAMVYNSKLVKTAPASFGDMVDYYLANKSSLKAGLCIAGGGMSWGALGVATALGAFPYKIKEDSSVDSADPMNATTVAANVDKYLLGSDGKSNGFFPATDTGCKDNFLAGKVPFAVIGNWDWKDYTAKGFKMNLSPVPGVANGSYAPSFGSVSGAFLTTYAAKHGVEAGAKTALFNIFGSRTGARMYQKIEGRPAASKDGAAFSPTAGQKGFAKVAGITSLPQIGAILDGDKTSYWEALPAFWTAVLVDGKSASAEATKLAAIFKANLAKGLKDL